MSIQNSLLKTISFRDSTQTRDDRILHIREFQFSVFVGSPEDGQRGSYGEASTGVRLNVMFTPFFLSN